MHAQHTKRRTSRQRRADLNLPWHDPRALNNILPDAIKVPSKLPARAFAALLGGREAGPHFFFEGYVIGSEAWVDECDERHLFVRCHDVRALIARANERLRKSYEH